MKSVTRLISGREFSSSSLLSQRKKLKDNLSATKLDLKVPEDFLAQLGCKPVTKFVGFYFDDADNYAVYDNGVFEDEVNRKSWECWKEQRQVASIFEDINRQWRDHGESHGLILDTDTDTFFRAEAGAIVSFLGRYYSKTKNLSDV